MVAWLTAIVALVGQGAPPDGFNLHRLFTVGETARYEVTIDVARYVLSPGANVAAEHRTITAGLMLNTVAIREGKATQALAVVAAEVQGNAKGVKAWELDALHTGVMREQVDRAGASTWSYKRADKPVNLTWLSLPLSPTEWAPPLPDRLLSMGDKFDGQLSFPLRAFFAERAWPAAVTVPTTFTFLGKEGLSFRMSRMGELKSSIKSSDGKGALTANLTALGSYNVDGMGRLAQSDLSWIVKLHAKAPVALGGLRTVEYSVNIKAKLVEVITPGGK